MGQHTDSLLMPPSALLASSEKRPLEGLLARLACRLCCLSLAELPEPARRPARSRPQHQPAGAVRLQAPAQAPALKVLEQAAAEAQAPGPRSLLGPLNVGFASVELCEVPSWPRHELRVVVLDGAFSEAGMEALLEFLDYVLELPLSRSGFTLTIDLREVVDLDFVSKVLCWSCEPERQAKWQLRCTCWKVAVSEGVCFHAARAILSGAFYLYPPMCKTYLVTDPQATPSEEDVCYHPEEGTDEARPEPTPCPTPRPAWIPAAPGAKLPGSIDVGFAKVAQGYCEVSRMGYLKIYGHDADVTEDGLTEMMAFMDAFVDSESAASGFSITYDLRSLHAPSMSMVTRVAEWGSEPHRQKKWEALNLACKVVVSAGIKYMLCKGVLSTFFYVCPPVCRTYLLTDPDEPEDSATIFEPAADPAAPTGRAEEQIGA